MEGKQESLDRYLPKLLDRFEHIEAGIKDDARLARCERRALVIAIAAIPVSILVAALVR